MSGPAAADPPIDEMAGDDLVPGWLRRLAAISWRILATAGFGVVLIAVAIQLGTVTAAVVVGLIVASTLAPYVQRLRVERGWGRTRSALVVSGAALVGLVLLVILLVVTFAPYVGAVTAAIQTGLDEVHDLLVDAGASPALVAAVDEATEAIRSWVGGLIGQVVGPLAALVTILILAGFLTFFLLQDGDRAWTAIAGGMDGWRAEALTERGKVALQRVGGYLRGTAVMAATDAVSDAIFLTLLGVPLVGPLAVLVFLGGFVPYVGGFLATTVLLLVTVSTAGVTAAVILLVLIVITNVIQGNVLGPVVYGRTVEIHPALVLMALPAGAALFGVIGLFAALPIVAFVIAITPAVIESLDTAPGKAGIPGLVPAWLDRLGQWSWRGLVVVGVLVLAIRIAIAIPGVIVPIVLATVLASTLEPAARALRARGLGHGQAALAVTVLSAVAVVGIVVLTIVAMFGSLPDIVDTSLIGAAATEVGPALDDFIASLGGGILASATAILRDVASLSVALILALLLTFYFLRDGSHWWAAALSRIHGRRREDIGEAGPRAMGILNGYMIGTGVISLFGAVTQWLIMALLGLPLALPIGILTFFGGFIPYIGSGITTLLGFLVALAVGTPTDVVVMAVFTVVFNIVQGNFVAPLVYGRTVSLHPAVVLLAIPAGAAVAGILGMFLVVPFLGIVATTWRTILHTFDPDEPEGPGTAPDAISQANGPVAAAPPV